jgi:uncharacterized protein YbjT (DUF2867 family)
VNGLSVVLLGATGLVGRACLLRLLREPRVERVVAPGRRAPDVPPDAPGAGKLEGRTVDFDGLEDHPDAFRGDALVVTLGTTIRKAGSRERFRTVDLGYVERAARLARRAGADHVLLVSSLGADPSSRFFYTRVKGETERAVLELGFPAATILRPSILLGSRDEFRPGEEIGRWLGYLAPARYRPVAADDVAAVLVHHVLHPPVGRAVVESRAIRELARNLR